MNLSQDNKAELFTAISKMQSELTGAFKGKQGHGYNYADLHQCIKTAQKPLSDNGLAVVQMLNETDKGTELITMLTHSSGGYVSSSFLMAKAVLMGGGGKNPAQTMGSSITYMRRYAYAAIIGLAQTDDDACNVKEIPATDRGVEEIKEAVSSNNYQYVRDNWTGIIKNKWQSLDSETVDKLNILYTQQEQ